MIFKANNLSKLRLRFLIYTAMLIALPSTANAIGGTNYISTTGGKNHFTLSASGTSTTLCISSKDFPGVIQALKDLKYSIGKVTNYQPAISFDKLPHKKRSGNRRNAG